MNVIGRIERKLNEVLGLKARELAAPRLVRELKKLQQELGFDPDQVLERLDLDPRLVRRLACALTVEETFFLRHPEHFERLVAHVRDGLAQRTDVMRIWSAGCASGEEPYSMAISIHRALGAEALSRASILASDVDATALQRARYGAYSAWSFRGTNPSSLRAYFEPHAGIDAYRLVPQMRAAVRFEHATLHEQVERFESASLDVIFFRNVGIYLTEAALESLYAGFARVLRIGGLLVLGPADPLPTHAALARSRLEGSSVHAKLMQRTPVTEPAQAVEKARPKPKPVEPARARSAPTAEQRRAAILVQAQSLADRGLTQEAVSTLTQELERGSSPDLLGLRGRIHLAEGDAERSAADLRAALELSPADSSLRFHYALALEVLQESRACRTEVQVLLRNLESRSDTEMLEAHALVRGEEATTVQSLRKAAHELLRRVE